MADKALPHVHVAGPMMHDDHLCLHVLCAVCQAPGLLVAGLWVDLNTILTTKKEP